METLLDKMLSCH